MYGNPEQMAAMAQALGPVESEVDFSGPSAEPVVAHREIVLAYHCRTGRVQMFGADPGGLGADVVVARFPAPDWASGLGSGEIELAGAREDWLDAVGVAMAGFVGQALPNLGAGPDWSGDSMGYWMRLTVRR